MTFNPMQCALVGVAGSQRDRPYLDRDSLQLYAELAVAAARDGGHRENGYRRLGHRGDLPPQRLHAQRRGVGVPADTAALQQRSRHGWGSHVLPCAGGACNAINAGVCNTVLVMAADPFLSVCFRTAIDLMAEFFDPQYELPMGFVTPAMFGFAAHRHMARVRNHERAVGPNGSLRAQERVSQSAGSVPQGHLRGRCLELAHDLRASSTCLTALPLLDGGGAFIVTSGERARSLRKPPVYIHGYGEAHELEYTDPNRDLTTSAAVRSGRAPMRPPPV